MSVTIPRTKTIPKSVAAPADDDALPSREAILALAENSAGIGVWEVDLTTGMARDTPQFFRIHGLEPTLGRLPIERIRALHHPEDRERVVAGFQEAMASGTDAYEIEYRIVRPGGEVRWIFGRGRVVRDASGKPVRYSGVDLDITERKETAAALAAAKVELEAEARRRMDAEARLRQAQKMAAVGQLAGGVAHDFNNILQVIMGNLELLKRAFERAPERELPREACSGPIDTVLKAARDAAQLTDRLLALSRVQPLEPKVLDVNELIADMSQLIRHTLGETIEVAATLRPGLWPAFSDRNQLQSAFLNLVVNARDAMPAGGRLLIETDNVAFDAAPAGPTADIAPGEYVLISVSDTGAGTPGPGLSMVYGFVKQCGGYARINSEVGQGTAVKLFLPRPQVAAPAAGASARSPGDGPPRGRAAIDGKA